MRPQDGRQYIQRLKVGPPDALLGFLNLPTYQRILNVPTLCMCGVDTMRGEHTLINCRRQTSSHQIKNFQYFQHNSGLLEQLDDKLRRTEEGLNNVFQL